MSHQHWSEDLCYLRDEIVLSLFWKNFIIFQYPFQTHALSVRRAVEGRRKPFDELLAEHRAAKEALLKAKAEASGKTYIPPGSKSPGSSHASSAATVAQLTAASKDHKSSSSSSGSTSLSQHSKLPKPALPLPPRCVG